LIFTGHSFTKRYLIQLMSSSLMHIQYMGFTHQIIISRVNWFISSHHCFRLSQYLCFYACLIPYYLFYCLPLIVMQSILIYAFLMLSSSLFKFAIIFNFVISNLFIFRVNHLNVGNISCTNHFHIIWKWYNWLIISYYLQMQNKVDLKECMCWYLQFVIRL